MTDDIQADRFERDKKSFSMTLISSSRHLTFSTRLGRVWILATCFLTGIPVVVELKLAPVLYKRCIRRTRWIEISKQVLRLVSAYCACLWWQVLRLHTVRQITTRNFNSVDYCLHLPFCMISRDGTTSLDVQPAHVLVKSTHRLVSSPCSWT